MKKALLILVSVFFYLNSGATSLVVDVATPGTLSTLVLDHSITELTLTGTIDASDFKFIRDELIDVTILDLSAITIADYTGNKGTASEASVYYPPNSIPQSAFFNSIAGVGRDSFTKITLPQSIFTIDDHAFDNCIGLKGTLVIPDKVTNIGVGAFNQCTSLSRIVLPNTTLTIEDQAFYQCIMVTEELFIPEKVSTIGTGAFCMIAGPIRVDPNNKFFSSLDGVLFDNDFSSLIQCPTSKTGTYTIPNTVKSIGVGAFDDCTELTGTLILPLLFSLSAKKHSLTVQDSQVYLLSLIH